MDSARHGAYKSYSSNVAKKPSFDHTFVSPCQAACPLHMEIREYVDLIAQGRVMEALQVIREDNPFPSICAYICSHPCEDACRRGQIDKPIAIRALKRFAVEFGGDRVIQPEAETTHEERIAIVGSGPAGLSAAYYLRKLGYPVTVFEACSELGGMLRAGIPKYRLPREVLDTEVQRLIRMGVEIRTNTRVVSLDLLFDMDYKAVFITVGAAQSRRLGIEGEDKPGVVDAITFLREVNLGLRPSIGESVVVVGGGNVAVDAARTALRLDAKKVDLVCLESRQEMPAFESDIQAAASEGIVINCSWGPRSIVADDKVTGIEFIRCTSVFDGGGRFDPSFDESVKTSLTADTLIIAIGQVPQIPEDFRVRIGRGSTIRVDPVTLTTNREGVFAGGDAVTGPATVVQALATGRQAAFRIDDYLQHRYPLVDKEEKESLLGDLLPKTIEMIRKLNRFEPPVLSPQARAKEFEPVELVYDWESAINEARRCLRCGMGAEILFQDKCATCLTCLRVCPYHVPYLDDSGTVQIPADQCQACGICVGECPARAIVLRKPQDRRHIDEELDHALKTAAQSKSRPLIIGFCCQYGLYGTGALARLWRQAKAGIWIVPVLCVAKIEAEHILRAFEMGAEGVFIAGCGQEQCAREDTAFWALQRIGKARKVLAQIGLEPKRLQAFNLYPTEGDPAKALDEFTEQIGEFYLASAIKQEVKT